MVKRTGGVRTASHAAVSKDTTSAPFLRFLERNKARFEAHMQRKLQHELRRFPRIGAPALATTTALVELCERGGKRIRPALVLAGARCISTRPPTSEFLDAAAALELLHGYFLVHDDWMDGDLTRRSGPSVHAALRRRFGHPHLGDAAAIMAGDWGVAVATDWMSRLRLERKVARSTLECFAEMQLSAVVGQIRDLLADDEDIEQTYQLKTASYTVSGPLLIGAIMAGASEVQRKSIRDFALPIGVAFQLKDDLIGVFAPPERTGKPFASDIRAGKRTTLVLECLRRASPAELRFLRRVLGNAAASERDLKRFVALLETTGARRHVEARIRVLHRRGMAKLAAAGLKSEGKQLLASAAVALIDRDA